MTNHDENNTALEFSPPFELKFVGGNDAGEFKGHAAFFGNQDSHRDVIRPGAFAQSLAAHKAAGTMPGLLWAHDQARPVGRLIDISDDGQGLAVRGKLNLDTTNGRDAHAHIKAGDVSGLSIGYRIPNGGATTGRDGVRTIQRASVDEVSLVTLPSNNRARIREVKLLANPDELINLLREKAGLSKRAAEGVAARGFAGLKSNTNPEIDIDRVADVLRRQALELKSWSS